MGLLLLVQKTDDCKQKEEKTKEQYLTKNTTKKMVTLLCLVPEAEAKEYQCVFTFITRRPFWSPWGIKALSLHCLCPSSLTLNKVIGCIAGIP